MRSLSRNVVLVDLGKNGDIDNAVVPAVLEQVLLDVHLKRSKNQNRADNVIVLSIDRPASSFHSLCQRNYIPQQNVIDGYSQWYPVGNQEESKKRQLPSQSRCMIHIGCTEGVNQGHESIVACVGNVLEHSQKNEAQVVVIDSLSTLISFSKGIRPFLDLVEAISDEISDDGSENADQLIFIATMQNMAKDESLSKALHRIADTYVSVSQSQSTAGQGIDSSVSELWDCVTIDFRKRKQSGRTHFERLLGFMNWEELRLRDVESKKEEGKRAPQTAEIRQNEEDLNMKLAEHGLSFRLSLSSKEREIRAAAGLPYMHQDEKLADSALQLHPDHLQLGKSSANQDACSSSEAEDSSEEELFSEDV